MGWLPAGSSQELAGLTGGREGQAGSRPCLITKSESWKHSSISRKLEKALEIFSSEYLALRRRFSGVFPVLYFVEGVGVGVGGILTELSRGHMQKGSPEGPASESFSSGSRGPC